jgi:hypothetical protein
MLLKGIRIAESAPIMKKIDDTEYSIEYEWLHIDVIPAISFTLNAQPLSRPSGLTPERHVSISVISENAVRMPADLVLTERKTKAILEKEVGYP